MLKRTFLAVVSSSLALTLVCFSAAASGDSGQAQIAVWSLNSDCGGTDSAIFFETLAGVETGCLTVPPALQSGAWNFASDGSMVGINGVTGALTLLRRDGQAVVLDSNTNDFDPSLSPDGSKIVFARSVPQNYQGAWPSGLWVVNADGSGLKQLVAPRSGGRLSAPTFSPDGGTIAYACDPAGFGGSCGPLPDGSYRAFAAFLVNADGSNNRAFLLNQKFDGFSWSADGKWVATDSIGPCDCSGGNTVNTEVFVYHTDGTDLFNSGDPADGLTGLPAREVTHETDVYGAALPQFLPGSNTQLIYYRAVDDTGGNWGYDYMINLDGTGRQELPLSSQGYAYGQILPAATGAGPPPFVNVMQVPVPKVRSLGYKTAVKRINAANLTVGTVKRKYSSAIPKNHVVSQSPRGGAYAHRTTRQAPRVSLTLSRGPR